MARSDSNPGPTFALEAAAIADGFSSVAGVDEAGRGPWAGPVVAAAVVLDRHAIPPGVNDSKTLGPMQRDRLYDQIVATADVAIAIGDVERIDRDNILAATMWAMSDALAKLSETPALALVDGNKLPRTACPARAIVRGDALSVSIAAASIIAKVTRDRMMAELDARYPGYGFARHKGYGTAAHSNALAQLGPCPEHRRSFSPIRALLAAASG